MAIAAVPTALRTYRVPLAAVVAGAVLTLVASLAPFIHFAYYSPSVHLVLETSAALVVLLAAYLLFGRFRTSRRANDLALIYPLVLFGINNLFVGFILLASDASTDPGALEEWVPALVRLIAAATFALASFVPPRTVESPVGAARFVAAAALGTLSVVAMVVTFFAGILPKAVEPPVGPTHVPTLTGHPLLLATYAVAAVLFALAAVGFARASTRDVDELMLWFSGGAVLAGVASVHYFLYPSRFSDWVYTGDFFRIGFYGLLLVGAAREIEKHWEGRAQAARLEERRRLARDLHDGLSQELAYIWRQTRRLSSSQNGPLVTALSGSVERALHESRRAVAALRAAPPQSLAAAMTEAVDTVASRVGTKVVVDVDESVVLAAETREELLRIACEAVANAGRHGRASFVQVEVANGASRVLRITDDGAGFDTSAPLPRDTFGLITMAERAKAVGGTLEIISEPGVGTCVELVLP